MDLWVIVKPDLAPNNLDKTSSYLEPFWYISNDCQNLHYSLIFSFFCSYNEKASSIKGKSLSKSCSLFDLTKRLVSHQTPSIGFNSQWYFGHHMILVTSYCLASLSKYVSRSSKAGWHDKISLILPRVIFLESERLTRRSSNHTKYSSMNWVKIWNRIEKNTN